MRIPLAVNAGTKATPSFASRAQARSWGTCSRLRFEPAARTPICRRVRDRGLNNHSPTEVDEEQDEDHAKPYVVRLNEIAAPRRVVA
jgi:hypothetical protein